jgi:hypothetical protein
MARVLFTGAKLAAENCPRASASVAAASAAAPALRQPSSFIAISSGVT